VTKYPAIQQPEYRSFSTENSKPAITRRYSEDLLQDRGDDEFGRRPSPTRGLTHQAQQHLRRLQMETQQLRMREEQRRIEQEKRAEAKQRIELELQKTKQELEQEDSLEELLAKPTESATRIGDYNSSKYSDYGSKADSTSITSDYSTTSSTTAGYDGRRHHHGHHRPSNSSDYSSNTSPSSVHTDHHCDIKPVPRGGGKYFVMSSTVDMITPHLGKHSARDDIDLYRGRHYSPFDQARVAGKGTLSRKREPPSGIIRRTIDFEDEVDASLLKRAASVRRKGSLDSLLDYYDKGDPLYMSSDSDKEGDDLLQSLTATFDQKLKILLDPKYAAGTPQRPSDRQSSPTPALRAKSAYPVMPRSQQERVRDSPFGPGFRDPNLHKPRSDPKVGIASRFERKDINGGSSPSHGSVKSERHHQAGLQRDLPDRSVSYDSSPRHEQSRNCSEFNKSKSEKTDANLLRQEHDYGEGGLSDHCYARELRKSSEILFGSRERLLDQSDPMAPSESPQVRKRDPTQKRCVRRRHTVGGVNDTEHFKALVALNSPPTERRESAWERLKPEVRDAESPEGRNIGSWLQQQRLHSAGSSPALFTDFSLQPIIHHSPSPPPIPPRYHSPPHHHQGAPPPYHHQHQGATPYHHPSSQVQSSYEHDHRYTSSSQENSRKSSPTSSENSTNIYPPRGRAATFTFESSI
jgi:hypothetical protein